MLLNCGVGEKLSAEELMLLNCGVESPLDCKQIQPVHQEDITVMCVYNYSK